MIRLLNVRTLEFSEFHTGNEPLYAVASHRWTADEVTYKDVKKRRNLHSAGFGKVRAFCSFIEARHASNKSRAARHWDPTSSVRWLWIDTCCIDKKSSEEVTESINSMFRWYKNATVCYAYLADVGSIRDRSSAIMDFVQSEWFRRGWTLQELIAPRTVIFLTRKWEVLGHKCQYPLCDGAECQHRGPILNAKIGKITQIPSPALLGPAAAHKYDAATKKLWAVGRLTTKIEDQAYCLLGIFGVHMPPLYGEGTHAWTRLDDEIAKADKACRMSMTSKHNSATSLENSRLRCSSEGGRSDSATFHSGDTSLGAKSDPIATRDDTRPRKRRRKIHPLCLPTSREQTPARTATPESIDPKTDSAIMEWIAKVQNVIGMIGTSMRMTDS